MKKMAVVASAVVVLMAVGMARADETQQPANAAGAQAVKSQTVCPVMGNAINKNLFMDYEGKRIYVCCPMCLPTLKKDPAKYVKQLEDQGITLDKTPAEQPKTQTTNAAAATAPACSCAGGCGK
jgi:YHS domain-containing protein